MVIFIASFIFNLLDQKIRLMKKYVKIKISVKLQCPQKRIIYQNLISIWSQTKCRILFMLILILSLKHIWIANNPANSWTTKTGKPITCIYLMPTIWGFENVENKRGREFMKMFFISLREHTKNIFDFEKKKMLPLVKAE